MQTIMWLRKFRKNKRGISTVIVVVLSLVILVVIVTNVVLWSYKMNQLDWERAHENFTFTVSSRSAWFTVQSEYKINSGTLRSGSYIDTQADDGRIEEFRERTSAPRTLDINGTFLIDLAKYPLDYIKAIEILIKFQASNIDEAWRLEAYDWISSTYKYTDFNFTGGFSPTTTTGWDYYGVNITNQLLNYINSDGKMFIKFNDTVADASSTIIRIDFLAVRAILSPLFSFKNNGAVTSHIVSIWIINSTTHTRYEVDYFINPGTSASFFNTNVYLPKSQYTVKVVTERGNIVIWHSE